MAKVYIAYTGGTIGMKKRAGSYAPAEGYLTERLAAMPEFQSDATPSYTLHEYTPLLDSANMRPQNWQAIAEDIAKNYAHYDGFVVIHGTDTMAYTASALSFMLENLAKPVILTGSQIPLVEVRSDARENLITSLLIAATYAIPEVCLYLNGSLLRGNRSTKVSSSGFDAFDSPNFPPLAEVGVDIEVRERLLLKKPRGSLKVRKLKEVQVAALRLFPGITADILENFLLEPIQGLVLETYGAGNAPSKDGALLDILARAVERGVVIVNCTQCLQGAVDMGDYATGNALKEVGVVNGYDMTPEAALTKLSYLFSRDLKVEEIRQKMQLDLRGELSPGLLL